MKEVSIYLMSGIKGSRKQDGYVAYCLEYYKPDSKYANTLIDCEPVSDMTGKRSELENLIRALKRMKEKCILSIYTDSVYLDMGIGEQRLVDRWQEKGWMCGEKKEVKNRDKWQEMLNLLNGNIYKVYLNQSNAYAGMLKEKLEMERRKNRNV